MKYLSSLLLPLLLLTACQSPQGSEFRPFAIQRGTNISHWLSQSNDRGEVRKNRFTQDDVNFIASIGMDHIRIPIDEEQMWDEQGNKNAAAFALLHDALGWCKAANLKAIVDLHILRSHHFNHDEKPLWTEAAAQEQFYQCWRDLSAELKGYANTEVAYELMNEAVAEDPEDWNQLLSKAIAVVRENEPERKILVGSNRWQSTETFGDLRIPENDPNLIISFHFYTPFLLTHYQASWTDISGYSGPIHYPGLTVSQTEIDKLEEPLKPAVINANGVFNRDSLEKRILKPIQFAKARNLQVYCGEWGSYPTTDEATRLRWYRDMRYILEKHGVAWTTWDYKGGFGIRDRQTGAPIQNLIDVLTKPLTQSYLTPDNLFAWCIVPFDSVERGPADRIAMLKELGIRRYAYDWRSQHLDDMPTEIAIARQNDIAINAIWIWIDAEKDRPGQLSSDNNRMLGILKKSGLHTDIWVGFHANYFEGLSDAEAVKKGKEMIGFLSKYAHNMGCKIALYNHGDWFGEPGNQVKIIEALPDEDIGIVYSFHHAHQQIDRFAEIIPVMLPYLSAVNLNGMRKEGPQILPLGAGDQEKGMIDQLIAAGYTGPFGILGHVETADVREILAANLAGIQALEQ